MRTYAGLKSDTFGKLKVVKFSHKERNNYYLCRCLCGGEKTVSVSQLNSGKVKSCGCLQSESLIKRFTTHGQCRSREALIYYGIVARCNNKNSVSYPNYGGRGIKLLITIEEFLKEVGKRPSKHHTIDRINNDGHYEKGNLKWSTWREQNSNTRRSVKYKYDGKELPAHEWSDIVGINVMTIRGRIKRGWSVEKALTKMPKKYNK